MNTKSIYKIFTVTIAVITIFTSFFAGVGQELAKEIIQRTKQGTKKLKEKQKN